MPLLLQKNISECITIAVWKIEEEESFFLNQVQLLLPVHHPHKRLQHLAGRYLLSLLYPQFPHHEMEINKAGKPYLPSEEYHFSVSHCGDYAAVIINTQEPAGIDIELFSEKTNRVKNKYLDKEELLYVSALCAAYPGYCTHYQLYTLCWCIKEAVYKWWGKGKIDFKGDIHIQTINFTTQTVIVLFTKTKVPLALSLSLLLLDQLSIVWTTDSKAIQLANSLFSK